MKITKSFYIGLSVFIFGMFILQIVVNSQYLKEGLEEPIFNTNIKCDKLCARIQKGQPCNLFESNKIIKCLDRNNILTEPRCKRSNKKTVGPCIGSV